MFISSDISFYILSLGCSKNLVDSELINGEMISAGFTPCQSSEDADIIIINTCGFIEDAKKESIEVIFDALSMKEGKTENRKSFSDSEGNRTADFPVRVVVAGCFSKRYFSEITEEIPEIDFLYGLPDSEFVPNMSQAFKIEITETVRERVQLYRSYPYSYLKISEGCSNNCSYCAIPLIKGPHRSYSSDSIMADASRAVRGGALELIVIAQDIAAYRYGETDLADLVGKVSSIDGLRWIRLLYCHPDHMNDRIIDLIAENEKVVPYLDIPFQHINGDILKSMGRRGNRTAYMDLIEKMRERIPQICIRSTFMVGYPGETEDQFSELLDFAEEARLDRVGCFTYSPEEGTGAFSLPDTVSSEEKGERLDRFMSLQREISIEKLNLLIGKEVEVLVEEKIDENTYLGRTQFDAPEVDGVFYLTSGRNRVNHIVRAKVTDSFEYDLIGEII